MPTARKEPKTSKKLGQSLKQPHEGASTPCGLRNAIAPQEARQTTRNRLFRAAGNGRFEHGIYNQYAKARPQKTGWLIANVTQG